MLAIIYGAFIMGCFVYAALMFFLKVDPDQSPLGSSKIVTYALTGMSVLMAILGFIIPPMIVNVSEASSPADFLMRFQTRTIIQASFPESIAIYGLILFMGGLERSYALVFVAAAVSILFVMAPGVAAGVERYRRMLADDR